MREVNARERFILRWVHTVNILKVCVYMYTSALKPQNIVYCLLVGSMCIRKGSHKFTEEHHHQVTKMGRKILQQIFPKNSRPNIVYHQHVVVLYLRVI